MVPDSIGPLTGEISLIEYVFIDNEWILLGFTTSTIYDSDTITAVQNDVPTWISNIT